MVKKEVGSKISLEYTNMKFNFPLKTKLNLAY